MPEPGQPGGVPLAPEPQPGAFTLNPETGELTIDLDKINRPEQDASGPWTGLQVKINPPFPLQLLTIKENPVENLAW
ncbi:MAG: hypothetical protein OXS29_13775 [bacterium]|nr:hypothetical protein [bacterium]